MTSQATRSASGTSPEGLSIGCHRHQSKSQAQDSVGARVLKGGWEGLDGRPRLVSLAPILEEHDPFPTGGRPSRPSPPLRTTLAPTDVDELFVRVMHMRADKSAVGAINRPLL